MGTDADEALAPALRRSQATVRELELLGTLNQVVLQLIWRSRKQLSVLCLGIAFLAFPQHLTIPTVRNETYFMFLFFHVIVLTYSFHIAGLWSPGRPGRSWPAARSHVPQPAWLYPRVFRGAGWRPASPASSVAARLGPRGAAL